QVTVQIPEYSNSSITLGYRFSYKFDSAFQVGSVISPKIIRIEKKKNTSTRLSSYTCLLLFVGSLCEQQSTLVRSWRRHEHPSLSFRQSGIFYQPKIQFPRIKSNGLIIICHDQGDVRDVLSHTKVKSKKLNSH